MIVSAVRSQPADDRPPPLLTRTRPAGGLRHPGRPAVGKRGPAAQSARYLQGLLLARDRNKTLTALADAEPIIGAQHREVQRLQWFLTESSWDHEAVNQRRIELLCADSATAPRAQGCW